jgi:hypothetical protein
MVILPQPFSENPAMTKSRLFGAAAMLAALVATPALALQEPGAYLQAHPWANDPYYPYARPGFWPGGVAIGVDSDSYAYYGGPTYEDPYAYDSYAYYGRRPARTTCGLPGATYLGPDGRWYPC